MVKKFSVIDRVEDDWRGRLRTIEVRTITIHYA